MVEIIGIQFRGQGKTYYFDPAGTKVNVGDYCVVETSRGTECGEVVLGNKMIAEAIIVQPLKPIIRLAGNEDMRRLQDNARREKEAWDICQTKVEEHQLDMKLVDVEYSFDGSKILFYFTSEGRVDFRELVKDLAAIFRTRIELRQIGVRDEAKTLGGLGVCGRPFCCSEFLSDFQPVSIKMAKEQGLSLNPTKISGTCGRLMCCLKYEQDAYEDLIKHTPKVGTSVECADGKGTVIDVSLLTGMCKVRIEGREDAAVCVCRCRDLKVLNKDGSVAYIPEDKKEEETEVHVEEPESIPQAAEEKSAEEEKTQPVKNIVIHDSLLSTPKEEEPKKAENGEKNNRRRKFYKNRHSKNKNTDK